MTATDNPCATSIPVYAGRGNRANLTYHCIARMREGGA